MANDQFPKDKDAPRSYPGRSALKLISQNDDFTWLRKRRGDAEARNKGGYLQVTAGAPPMLDGYYSLGFVSGIQRVVGSPTARGAFGDRGPFLVFDGFVPGSANLIYNSGLGVGAVPASEALGFVQNNQDISCQIFLIHIWETKNGTKFSEAYSFYMTRIQPSLSQVYLSAVAPLVPPAIYGPPGDRHKTRLGIGVSVITDDHQWKWCYIYDVEGTTSLVFPPVEPDQYTYDFIPARMNPTTLFALGTYMRSQLPPEVPAGTPVPNPINNAACLGYAGLFSFNNGLTWVEASSMSFFEEFDDTMLPLPPEHPVTGSANTNANWCFNTAVAYMGLGTAPRSANLSIAIGLVPYTDNPDPAGGTTDVRAKIKLGWVDAAAQTVTATLTLFDGSLVAADGFIGEIVPVEGGVVFRTHPIVNPGNPHLDHPVFHFTADAVSMATSPTFPYARWQTGRMVSLSPTEIGITVYDGGYKLLSSKDWGATWTQRATVSPNGLPPSAFNQYFSLTEFANVSQLRASGTPANGMPGAPWACDSKYDPPIL